MNISPKKHQLIEELKKEREMNQAKTLFVNMISHEMRTPLAVIQGAADLLEHCYDGLSDRDRRNYIQSIKKAILRMTHTMDTVLILGKVQNNQLSFQPLKTDVLKFCSNIVNEIENLNEGRRIILQSSKIFPRELDIDTTLLYHIVSNLLSNAIKYSDSGKMVYLKLTYDQEFLTIWVKDFGIGIPKSEMDNIFKLFYRGSNISSRKGIGIGMFIVGHCVALHGGSIEVNSKVNAETTFKVTLPTLHHHP
ncbi:MAG: HAMP domain-containing histidine kinase [Puniceicoccales bacterium]|jgi:signal transduction histidine kinase|nr:HAMP domain-containing histidine kinase [Puniceicoccales bacterium]